MPGVLDINVNHGYDNEYHIHDSFQFIEIIYENEMASIGELVITNLSRKINPVLRMKTGDLASFSTNQTCQCGMFGKRIILQGRAGNIIKIGREKIDLNILLQIKEKLNIHSDDFFINISI